MDYFTSDTHFWRHDDPLLDAINETVGEHDRLFHLGDFVDYRGSSYLAKCKRYRERIRCKNLHLVWGNHDQPELAGLFSSAHLRLTLFIGKQELTLSHYAMAIWPHIQRGAWHLYGHSHGTAEALLDELMPGRRALDVGPENAARLLGRERPFSFQELRDLLKPRRGFYPDYHEPLQLGWLDLIG